MADLFSPETSPLTWGFLMLLLGAGGVAFAKVYGLFFMRHKTPHRVGNAMNVTRAEVTEWSGKEGYVMAGGELWRAMSDATLNPGDQVTVASMNGLVLRVKKK